MRFYFLFSICLAICICHFPDFALAQSRSITLGPKQQESILPSDIEAAQLELQSAAIHFDKLARLAKRGSVSSFDFKEAEYEKRVAELRLQALQDPLRAAANLVLMASLKVDLEQSHFEVAKRLFKSRSVSELKYRRQAYKLKSAKIALRAATGEISEEAASLLTLRGQAELAKIELELGQKLLKRRSITQATFQKLSQRLKEAQSKVRELEQSQQSKRDAIKSKTRT